MICNGDIDQPTKALIHPAKQSMSNTLIYGTPRNFIRG
jgi:hypothetical protein